MSNQDAKDKILLALFDIGDALDQWNQQPHQRGEILDMGDYLDHQLGMLRTLAADISRTATAGSREFHAP